MKRSLFLFVLFAVFVLLVAGCAPKSEVDSATGVAPTSPTGGEGQAAFPPAQAPAEAEDDAAGDATDADGATEADDEEDEDGEEAEDYESNPTPRPQISGVAGAGGAVAKLAVHRDAAGEIQCPVMGSTIESEKAAVGHQDYKGVRYYFCCGDCPKLFAKDPENWIKK